jgi:hypothetical protein
MRDITHADFTEINLLGIFRNYYATLSQFDTSLRIFCICHFQSSTNLFGFCGMAVTWHGKWEFFAFKMGILNRKFAPGMGI